MQTGFSPLHRPLRACIGFVEKHSVAVVFAGVAAAVLALWYTANNLGMNTRTKDMLSPELPWRQSDLEYERQFPQYTDNILVVVEAKTPDQALDAADRIYHRLLAERKLFKSIYYPNALSLFRESAMLFLARDELQDLADSLAAIQPVLSRLIEDQTLRGLFTMLSEALDAIDEGEDIDLAPLVKQLNRAFSGLEKGEPVRVSWHRLMSGANDTDLVYREFIVLQPVLDDGDLLPAARHIQLLRSLPEELRIESELGARMRLTGSSVLAHEELLSVARGTEVSLALATTLVTVILLFGLGSLRLTAASLLTLLVGLIITAAFAALTVGELNLISVAFAILYIGLGVEYTIHYCLRYRELLAAGAEPQEAIREASVHIGGSLFLCAATTAVAFLAFLPTDYRGVAELGWISGAGIFISLFVTLTLLPALLMLMPLPRPRAVAGRNYGNWVNRISEFPLTHARAIRVASVLLLLALLLIAGKIRFDYNTLNLQDPENESVRTFQDLLADSNTSPWSGIMLARDRAEARKLLQRLEQLPVVEKTIWLEDFIPPEQDEKLAIIEEMNLLLGEMPDSTASMSVSDEDKLAALDGFLTRLERSDLAAEQPTFLRLRLHLRDYLDGIVALTPTERHSALQNLSTALLKSLPGRLETLRASLDAHAISIRSLPGDLLRRWQSPDGHYLIEIRPRENISDNDALRRFVEELQEIDPRVIGAPVVTLEASDAVIKAFRQAFLYAFCMIALLLLMLLHRKRDVIYVLLPLLMAALLTAGASVLLDIPFNFANIIALPLLLGIGVDSGIHIVHRFRTSSGPTMDLLRTSSARAVVVSALTAIGGIGNLAFSPHLGTASMGKLLTIGIAITLICMLVVLPSLLPRRPHKTETA